MLIPRMVMFFLLSALCGAADLCAADEANWYNGSWVLDVDASVDYVSTYSTRPVSVLRDAYSKNKDRFRVKIDGSMLELAYRMNFFIRKDIDVRLDLVSVDEEMAVFNGTIIRGYEKKQKTLYFIRMENDHMRIEDIDGELPLIVWARK